MSEELDKTPAILNIDSEIESRHHPIQHANVFPPSIQPTHRVCTSLPLYLTKSDLCTLVPRPGMEYVPLRTPAAEPYHYHHVTDQTKSLQELQNEVGALLEFRDLVIETFPDLKTKMASSAANSTLTGIPSSSSSLAIRREWEPGIRIRRKLIPKDTGSGSIGGGGSSSSTTIIPGGGGSNSGSISGSSNHSNHAGGHGASSGGAPVGAGSVAGSSNSSNSSSTTTTTALNQQQPQQQQHTHQHHHHHHHHTHTQHGSNSSGNHHPHQQQQQQHSSSSLIRSRSNSHSGKKEPKSGEGNNGSVIQDSGFSTETSSSKETHSAASSTSGAVQGALILSTTINRLAVETEDELWNLLDVIHRKGSRLREEVDQHLEREKNRTTNLAINHPLHHHPADHPPHPHPQPQSHHHHHHHPHLQQQQQQQQQHAAAVPTSSAAPVHLQQQRAVVTTTARVGTGGDSHSGSSSSSSSSGNNITIHHSNPATTTTTTSNVASSGSAVSATLVSPNTTTSTVIVSSAGAPTVAAGGGGTLLAKNFQNQLLGAGRRELPLSASVSGSGGGSAATTTTTAAAAAATPVVDHNVQILRNERDRLLDKLSAYEAETFAGRMREAKMHDELETLTLTMRDLQEQLKVAHSQKLELNSKLHDLHLQTVNRSAPSSPESIKVRQQQQQQQQHQGSAPPQTSSSSSSAAGAGQHAPKPATRYHQPHYQHGAATSGKPSTAATASPHEDPLLVEGATVAAPGVGGGLGRLDALLGSPRLPKVRSLDSKKIAAILLETNIVELQRHLLTVTVQNQVLQQRLEQATRSRLFLSEKFEKSKEDLDDLRFQLMEKSIELEGTKAQLRVIESKSTGGGKSAPPSAETSPEHTGRGSATVAQQQHQHHSGHLLQHHPLHHHHHHHHHQQQQHQQQQQQQHHLHQPHPGVPSVAVNSQLAMRLPSSQVSTPSMKAMTPVAMDDMIAQHQQHSSSTESAQDQAERDSIGARLQQQPSHHQAPETPRRRPSKIPLPGTKGSSAPKPPSGRNFSATPTPTTPTGPTAMQRTLGGGGGGSSGPSSNRSLTKSTGSLYVKSSDASSFGAQHQHLVTTATTTTTTGSSWRNSSSSSSNSTSKDTPSLEKSRSSSIPISATPKGSQQQAPLPGERGTPMGTRGTPTMMTLPPPPIPPSAGCYGGGVVSSSPLPRPKRDTLTTKVKNCDSLSRKQSMRKDAPSASIGSGQSATFAGGSPAAAPAPAVRERKPSAGGGVLRHASSSSLGSGGHAGDTASGMATSQQPASGNANSSTIGTTTTTSDNGKARRSSTFRLAKPTLMPLLLATGPPGPGLVQTLPLPGIGPAHDATAGAAAAAVDDASPQRSGVILRVGGAAAAAGRPRSQTATGGTVPSASVVRAAFSTPSVSGEQEEEQEEEAGHRPLLFPGDRIARNLIGEYLAAKRTRSAAQHQEQQQPQMMPIPPPIFHVLQSPSAGHLVSRQRCERQNDELAYRHPRLLMTDDEADEVSGGASAPFSTGYRVGESEGDCSIELVLQDDAAGTNGPDDREEETSAANESLIVPRPKMIAFHSLKGAKERQQQQQPTSSTCRLVGKVNPNILKTWEQLSGGGGLQHNSCVHQQPQRRSASAGRILLLAEECSVGGTTSEGPAAAPPHRLRAATSPSSSGYLHFDTGDGGDGEQADEASDDGESADERQSYLLYCPQQQPYHHHLGGGDGDEGEREAEEEVIEFKVNKLKHHPAAVASAADTRTTSSSGTSTGVTTTTVGSTTSEGGDFYDSIDAVSTCVREPSVATRPGHGAFLPGGEEDDVDDNYTDLPSVAGGGEGLAEFTSIDRKRLLWSIEIGEQQ